MNSVKFDAISVLFTAWKRVFNPVRTKDVLYWEDDEEKDTLGFRSDDEFPSEVGSWARENVSLFPVGDFLLFF